MIYAVILGTATSVVLLKCIGRLHPVVYYLKCTGHGVWIFLLSIVCLPYFIVRKKGPDYAWFALNPYAAYGRHVMGQRFEFTLPLKEVRKRLPPGGIIVANHQSSIDAFGVVEIWRAVGRMSIVVKKVFKYFGMLGLIGYLTGMLFIDRRKSSEALSSLSVAAIQCQETGTRIIMFPEGTRHHQKGVKRMLPFKKGAFVAAVDSGAPICPVVFPHYDHIDHSTKTLPSAVINVDVLEPIETKGRAAEEVMDETRSKMLQTFQRLPSVCPAN